LGSLYYNVGEVVVLLIIGIPATLILIKLGEWFLILWEDIFGEVGKRILFSVIKWVFCLGVLGVWIFYLIQFFYEEKFITVIINLIFIIGFIYELLKQNK